jgi:hypothetical protein
MDMVKDVLEDSLRHAFDVLEAYRKKIDSLPKGGIYAKTINGNVYYYLSHREGKKVKTDYLGKLSDEEIKEIREKIEKRKRYEKMLKDVEAEIKFLHKALKTQRTY